MGGIVVVGLSCLVLCFSKDVFVLVLVVSVLLVMKFSICR